MGSFLQGFSVVGGLLGIFAFVYAYTLRTQVTQIQRELSKVTQTLKAFPKDTSEVIDPLRVQLAAVAAGLPVPEELIRQGRLYRDLSSAEVQTNLTTTGNPTQDNMVILDVRTAKEYDNGHIVGAIHIPIEELDQRYTTEIPATGRQIYVYCANGERSRLACDYLSRQGYLNLINIQDGLQRWRGDLEGGVAAELIQIQSKSKAYT